MPMPEQIDDIIVVSGCRVDGKPFLTIKWGEMHGQMDMAEARQHALGILECCVAAESDGALTKFLQRVGSPPEIQRQALLAVRHERGQLDATRARSHRGKFGDVHAQDLGNEDE